MSTSAVTPSQGPRSPLARGRFSRLPSELQVMILRYVYEPDLEHYLVYLGNGEPEPNPLGSRREQLKPLRLISRIFHDAVTPIVFASIHIHASDLSIRRAENIANSHLAGHVREIVHHEGTFAGASQDEQVFLKMLTSHQRRQDYPKSFKFAAPDVLYGNYLAEVAVADEFEGFEVSRMTALLNSLPRCVTFTTLPSTTQWCDPTTSAYTLRRTGLSYLPRARSLKARGDRSFVSSLVEWKPRALNLSNFSYQTLCSLLDSTVGTTLPPDSTAPAENWADRLIYLKVGWPDGGRFPFEDHLDIFQYMTRLTRFLQHCHNLTHLELTHGFDVPPHYPVFPNNGLSRLTYLTISKGSMDGNWAEETVFKYVKHLGGTLEHLHFDNVSLQRYLNTPHLRGKNDGSLFRLLFNFTPCTTLKTCTGLATVNDIKSNVRMKQRFVLPGYKPGKPGRPMLLAKAEEAVCHQRAWPKHFDMAQLPMDVTASNWDTEELTEEAAFIFSSWEDTVDPWDAQNGYVDPASNIEEEIIQTQEMIMQHEIEDRAPAKDTPDAPQVKQDAKAAKSKRRKFLKILGLD